MIMHKEVQKAYEDGYKKGKQDMLQKITNLVTKHFGLVIEREIQQKGIRQ